MRRRRSPSSTLVGATTAFFAATVGLVQNDIKRIVAYSTCSQLGYMFVAMGVGAYSVGMFHLFTHAFFKALLFLGSGSVIMAMHHEQDIRKMGGLRHKIPFTYWTMVIGTLALTGFPFTAGYFSKDAIIEAAYRRARTVRDLRLRDDGRGGGMTAFYSWRLIYKTFHGTPHDQHHYERRMRARRWSWCRSACWRSGRSRRASRSRSSSPAITSRFLPRGAEAGRHHRGHASRARRRWLTCRP